MVERLRCPDENILSHISNFLLYKNRPSDPVSLVNFLVSCIIFTPIHQKYPVSNISKMPMSRALMTIRALVRQPTRSNSLGSRYSKINHSCFRAYSDGGAFRSGLTSILKVSPEVEDAVKTNKPVVALESTIYTHGELGVDLRLEAIAREHGAVPAVIGVLNGVPMVGLTPTERDRMITEGAKKVSRRDLAYLVGMVRNPPEMVNAILT
jgi:hypothetical protein